MSSYLDGVGKRIRSLRQAKRLSREALAEMVGVHWGTLGSWERGECLPFHTNFGLLATALDTTEEYLRTGIFGDADDGSGDDLKAPSSQSDDEPQSVSRIGPAIDECRRQIEAIEGRRVRLLLEFLE